jgi:hypothetical protein
MNGFNTIAILSLLTVAAGQVNGQETSQLNWHGYISQGLTQSKDGNFITSDNQITAELTEIGLNGHYQISNNLSVAGQVVYLDGGNRFKQGTRIDYLFIDWTIPDLAGWQAQIHLGRFKNRHWLYSVTRDVPQTRDTAVLPQSVYFDSFRDVALGSNGIQTSFTKYTDSNIWQVNWGYGRSELGDEQRDFYLGSEAKGEIEQDFVHQFSVYWQPSSMNWKLGLSWLDSDFTYTPSEDDIRFSGGSNIRRFMFSMQYFSENWELSSEILREIQDLSGAFSPDYFDKRIGEGGFVQLRYLFSNKFSGLVGYDTYVSDVDDPDGKLLEAQSFGQIPAYFGYMDTTTVGLRWDIAPRWRLQAEHHWVEGANRVVSLLDPNIGATTDKHWRMWSVQLMYWF